MNKFSTKIIDNLLQNSEHKLSLKLLEKVLLNGIPFNIPHKFRFQELTDEKVRIVLPYKRFNKNHLGGIHACATATLGELPAGLCLLKKFGSSNFRLIMQEIKVEYFKQAKSDLVGEASINSKSLTRLQSELDKNDQAKITITTQIYNPEKEVIATVQTTWQLKAWNKVSFKN